MSMSLKKKVKELDARVTALEEGNSSETPSEETQNNSSETPSEETQNGGE